MLSGTLKQITWIYWGKSPQLVWFGNGEVKPVRIQFYYQQQPIGNELELDYLGKYMKINTSNKMTNRQFSLLDKKSDSLNFQTIAEVKLHSLKIQKALRC